MSLDMRRLDIAFIFCLPEKFKVDQIEAKNYIEN